MHFPPVRAHGYPYAGVLSLRKPVNNAANRQAADQPSTNYFILQASIMNFHFFHNPTKFQADDAARHPVVVYEHPHNTNEGSEFLDDAIRIKDQPLMYTEQNIAPGCPDGLL